MEFHGKSDSVKGIVVDPWKLGCNFDIFFQINHYAKYTIIFKIISHRRFISFRFVPFEIIIILNDNVIFKIIIERIPFNPSVDILTFFSEKNSKDKDSNDISNYTDKERREWPAMPISNLQIIHENLKNSPIFLVNPFLLSIFLIRIAQKTRHRFSIFLIILRKLKITYSKSPRVNLQRFIFFFLFSRSHNEILSGIRDIDSNSFSRSFIEDKFIRERTLEFEKAREETLNQSCSVLSGETPI